MIQLPLQGHARATPHYPELVLNNFVTRLGHAVGRMFQTTFPPMPEFQGRQVVTLHNQRDFLFFRRHRCVLAPYSTLMLLINCFSYAFRSTEKVALQEIGPRFTLKLRWLKKGIPAVRNFGEEPKGLEFDNEADQKDEALSGNDDPMKPKKVVPPKEDEFLWTWKVRGFSSVIIRCLMPLPHSLNLKPLGEHSFCRLNYFVRSYSPIECRYYQLTKEWSCTCPEQP
jgi:ribosome production factor 1